MRYVLESDREFDRLERQSEQSNYDFRKELSGFRASKGQRILDAGCGSGVVSRYLARSFPDSEVVAVDFSEDRVEQARLKAQAQGLSNVRFEMKDLTREPPAKSEFDRSVCRYVLEHLSGAQREATLGNLFECLKPGGELWVVDIDGFFYNTYPLNGFLEECLARIRGYGGFDFCVGRKIPSLMREAGFSAIEWEIDPMVFRGEALASEIGLLKERFIQAAEVLSQILGDRLSERFRDEYLAALAQPEAVLFYNKFIVRGRRPDITRRDGK